MQLFGRPIAIHALATARGLLPQALSGDVVAVAPALEALVA